MLKVHDQNDILKRITHKEINYILRLNNIRKYLSKGDKYTYKINDL